MSLWIAVGIQVYRQHLFAGKLQLIIQFIQYF